MKNRKWEYLTFLWSDLTEDNKKIFEQIELDLLPVKRDVSKLLEADLSVDQINKIFLSAEEVSRDKNLRTKFGTAISFPKDTIIKINSVVTNFGQRLQNSTPVKNIDEKFARIQEVLRKRLDNSDNGRKVLSFVDTLGNFAKKHPNWQAAIIGLLTAVSGLALGPAAIPVIAAVLKGATELLKGELLSTATGKGLYAGALGYLGAQLASAVMGFFESVYIASLTPIGPAELGFESITFSARSVHVADGMEWTRWFKIDNAIVDQATKASIADTILQIGAGDLSAYDRLIEIARQIAAPEYLQELRNSVSAANISRISNDGFLASIKAIGNYVIAAAGGAATALGDIKKKKSVPESLTLPVMEGLWADLTLTFGAGKLLKAWNQAGKPTDSVDIAKMLAEMGMTTSDIKDVLTKAGVASGDVENTMRDLALADDADIQIPFTVGIPKLDNEAKIIFKTHGKDEFIKFWETKLAELEKKISPDSTTTTSKIEPDNKVEWEKFRDQIEDAMTNKNIPEIKNLLSKVSKLSSAQYQVLQSSLRWSGITEPDKGDIEQILKLSMVAEMTIFKSLSKMLKEHNLTWKDIGYRCVINETLTNRVVLI